MVGRGWRCIGFVSVSSHPVDYEATNPTAIPPWAEAPATPSAADRPADATAAACAICGRATAPSRCVVCGVAALCRWERVVSG